MMRSFLLIVFSLLGVVTVVAQPQPMPSIACDEPMFDFGEADTTEPIEHTFYIRNNGPGVLEISRIKKSCGCTRADMSSMVLQPGEEAELSTTLTLKGAGHKSIRINIYSNDPQNPDFELGMRGTAISQIEVEPSTLSVGNVQRGEGGSAEVLMFGKPGVTFEITGVRSLRNVVVPTFEKREGEGFGPSTFAIRADVPADMPQGQIYDQIRVETNHPKIPHLDVQVAGFVVGDLRIVPEKLFFTRRDRPITRYMSITPGAVTDFTITEVEWPTEGVDVEIKETRNGGYRLAIRNIIADDELADSVVRIHTDLESMPVIEVPITVREP